MSNLKTSTSNQIILEPTLFKLADSGVESTMESNGPSLIQVSVHGVESKALLRECSLVFPGVRVDDILVVSTMQQSHMNLVCFGDEVEIEKERLLESFFKFSETICKSLESKGFWADYIDPCSGLPMRTKSGNKIYSEVESAQVLLSYRCMNAGCCKVLLHPVWGSAVYPASVFTTAPFDVLLDVMYGSFGTVSVNGDPIVRK